MQVLNNLQIFTVWSDEINGRIDPSFYRPDFKELEGVLNESKFELETFREISVKISSGATPLSGGDSYINKGEGIPFIRSGDLNADKSLNFDELLYVKEKVHQTKLKSSQLKRGDLLIAIVGATIGQVSLYDYDGEANINQAIALVRFKEGINPEYAKEYLLTSLGQNQLNKIKRPVARANINLDEIASIKIPLPPLPIQNKIVSIIQEAYEEKREKEAEAQRLLDSIDDYVLGELGIKIPEIKKEMIFEVWSDEIENSRIDSEYWQPKFIEFEKVLNAGKFEVKKFGNVMDKIINGLDYRKFSESGKVYLRVSNIKFSGIDLRDVKFIELDNVSKDIKLKIGDILLTRKGTFGVAQCVHKSTDYFISSEIFRIKIKDGINSDFIKIILNSNIGQTQFNKCKIGAIMGSLSQDVVRDISIPIPPVSIQNKISEKVEFLYFKSDQLKKEAKEVLEKVKREVEEMILA